MPWLHVALVSPARATSAQPRDRLWRGGRPGCPPFSTPSMHALSHRFSQDEQRACQAPATPWARTPPGFLQPCLCCGSPKVAAAGPSPRAGAAGRWNPVLRVPTSRIPDGSLLISGVVTGGPTTSARRQPFSQGLLSSPAKARQPAFRGPPALQCSHGGSPPGQATRCVLRAPGRRFCQAYLAPGDPSDRSLFEGTPEVFVQQFQPHRVHGRQLPVALEPVS